MTLNGQRYALAAEVQVIDGHRNLGEILPARATGEPPGVVDEQVELSETRFRGLPGGGFGVQFAVGDPAQWPKSPDQQCNGQHKN